MLNIPQFALHKKEWLAVLRELHNKWGGKLDEGDAAIPAYAPTAQIPANYASLLINTRNYKVFLSRMVSADAGVEIYVYGKWKTELFLFPENVADKVMKFLRLEHEITLPGKETNIIIFNRKYLIKGEPRGLITGLLSDKANEDIVSGLGDFAGLHIKDNLARLVYELSKDIIKSEVLAEKVNHLIDFLQALEQKESAPTK